MLLHQVQRRGKGGQWAFRLGKPVLDAAIDALAAAWPEETLFLVDGAAAVGNVASLYREPKRSDFLASEVPARMRTFYDAPLRRYVRGETVICRGLAFRALTPVVACATHVQDYEETRTCP